MLKSKLVFEHPVCPIIIVFETCKGVNTDLLI